MEREKHPSELRQSMVLQSESEVTENEAIVTMFDELLGRKEINRKSTNRISTEDLGI